MERADPYCLISFRAKHTITYTNIEPSFLVVVAVVVWSSKKAQWNELQSAHMKEKREKKKTSGKHDESSKAFNYIISRPVSSRSLPAPTGWWRSCKLLKILTEARTCATFIFCLFGFVRRVFARSASFMSFLFLWRRHISLTSTLVHSCLADGLWFVLIVSKGCANCLTMKADQLMNKADNSSCLRFFVSILCDIVNNYTILPYNTITDKQPKNIFLLSNASFRTLFLTVYDFGTL